MIRRVIVPHNRPWPCAHCFYEICPCVCKLQVPTSAFSRRFVKSFSKMQCRRQILLSLMALCWVADGSCFSPRSSDSHSSIVKGGDTHTELIDVGKGRFSTGLRIPRTSGALRFVEILARGSVILATLFLLSRCVSYLSEVPRVRERSQRLLAEKDPSKGEVSKLRQVVAHYS